MTELDVSVNNALWENDEARFIRFVNSGYQPLTNLESSGGTGIMNTTAPPQQRLREIVCSNCGDGLGEFANTRPFSKLGPCCTDLPEPWELDGETNTYTAPAGSTAEEEPDHDPDTYECRYERGELDSVEIDRLPDPERYRREYLG